MLAEALGTFILVVVVLGSSSLQTGASQTHSIAPAVAAGLSVVSLVQSFGDISGAQLNPAITSALVCARRLDLLHGLAFGVAQILGATFASAIFYLFLPASVFSQLVTRVSVPPQRMAIDLPITHSSNQMRIACIVNPCHL